MYKDKSSVNESCSSTSSDNSTKTVLKASSIPGPSTSSYQQNKINTDTAFITTTTTITTSKTIATESAITSNKLLQQDCRSSSSIIDSNNSIDLLTLSSENLSYTNFHPNFQKSQYQSSSSSTSLYKRRPSHPVFSFQSEDINLITDIGYIAKQVHRLEKKYSNLSIFLGPYDYHKEIENSALNIQNNKSNHYATQHFIAATSTTTQSIAKNDDGALEQITNSDTNSSKAETIPQIQQLSSQLQFCNIDENSKILDKNSLEIESLGPFSNIIKNNTTISSYSAQLQPIDNIQQQQQQQAQAQQEFARLKRTELLEELLIKFYRCQEDHIKIQEQIDYQKEIERRFPKNIYIMSCGSIEKLLSLDDQKNLNNINYNNSRKQTITTASQQQNDNNSCSTAQTKTTTTTTDDSPLHTKTTTTTTVGRYYAGSKLFGIPSTLQSQTTASTSPSKSTIVTTTVQTIVPLNNSKIITSTTVATTATTAAAITSNISPSSSNSNKLSARQNSIKQCSRSSGSLNASNQQLDTFGSQHLQLQQTPTNRTIGIIKQQSSLPPALTNSNRRSSSSMVENRTNSNIHDLKAELLNNSRKFSCSALSSDVICGRSSSSINTSSQSSFKSAASSSAFLKNDNSFLQATTSANAQTDNGEANGTTKGSAISLSRSSGNVHFADDEKSSMTNLLQIANELKTAAAFKSTSDIISHCCSGGEVGMAGPSRDINNIGMGDLKANSGPGSDSTSNINSNSSICLIERRNSNKDRTATQQLTTTTIVCSTSCSGDNVVSSGTDYSSQNNNSFSNNGNTNNNINVSHNNNNNSDSGNNIINNINNINNNNNNKCNLNNVINNNNININNSNFNINNEMRKDSSGSSNSGKGSEFNLIQLQNTIIQCQFNNDDLRTVVGDLKRKIDYTEKMNWLCLSKRPIGPPHRKTSLTKHSEVKKRFLEICDMTLSDEVRSALRLPAFDSYDWEDADVIYLMQTMFIELGLIDKFNIPVDILREWLYEVYKHYNEVPFHNFRHCFCVAQMMYAMCQKANLCQRIGELEVLILLVSCICHDLDHPGYNNIYQINARTELALRYNDISPLENHHCSIAFRLLEHPDCNIFKNFNRETFNFIREGIIRCILATDMARHNEILTQFKEISPNFDYSNRSHINLFCMVLIKVADISNEARPMDVAEPWLDRLLQEFFAQSAAEKSEGLPVTPFMDPDKVSKPGSQVRFIGLVLLPLFEALGDLVPEIIELIIIPVRIALDYYKCLNDAQNKQRKSIAESNAENGSDTNGSCSPQIPRSQSGISVKSRRSIPSQKSASRTSVDEPACVAAELHDLPEGSESGDSETATEVDVAEKTSKFKVDTESGNRSKSSHSTCHRKSNREKRPSMISEMCSSGGRMRNSYGNIHGHHSNRGNFGSNRAVSLDQYSCNNRRSSDGLQQVISDSYVFYNRQNESLQSQQNSSGSTSTPASDKLKSEHHGPIAIGEDAVNMNSSQAYCEHHMQRQMSLQCQSATASIASIAQQQYNQQQYLQHLQHHHHQQQQQQLQQQDQNQKLEPTNVKNGAGSGGTKDSTGDNLQQCSNNLQQKSWRARFKQITDIFSIFDKGNKRLNNSKGGSGPVRNNNTMVVSKDIAKQGLCGTISNSYFPSNAKQKQLKHQQSQYINNQASEVPSIGGRSRAYSLDVPCSTYRQQRYSSSSGGESRKSSRNEDNSNRQDVFTEDNNSYNTSSGEGPPIRISGGDGFEGSQPISSQPLPKVITPTFEEDLTDSAMSVDHHHQQPHNLDGSSPHSCGSMPDNSSGVGRNYSNSNQPKI